jgi:hypothetical protein
MNTHLVFYCCSVGLFYTFWPKMNKICIVLPKIFSKTLFFDRFSWIFRRTRFFLENPSSSVCAHYWSETSCQVSERSYDLFVRKTPDRQTDKRTSRSIYRTNLLCWRVQQNVGWINWKTNINLAQSGPTFQFMGPNNYTQTQILTILSAFSMARFWNCARAWLSMMNSW